MHNLINIKFVVQLIQIFLFIEMLISFFLILLLIFLLVKKNYIQIYSLTLLNIVICILLITYFIQSYVLNHFFYKSSFIISYEFLWTFPQYTYELLMTGINYELYKTQKNNFLFFYNYPYYSNNFNFNIFIYYVKFFSLIVFLLSLLIGYLQIKIIKISFDKLLLILLPIFFSNLILINTQDLIIAYLSIEFQNLCLIFLMSLKKKQNYNIQLSIRFFMLNSIGSLLILFGIILLYSIFLTTNLVDIYILLNTSPKFLYDFYMFEILFSLSMLLLGLFFKLAVGPFGLWLIEIYEYSLTYGILIFSLLPKIGYFIFLFNLYLSTSYFLFFWDYIFKIFGIISILFGTFGALSQIYVKRLLAFSSLNYFGYILLSFIGFNEKSLIICIFYFFIYVCINFYIWFIIMYLEKVLERNIVLVDLVVLRIHYPMLAMLLSLSFFFLAGLPPFYLFVLKFSTFYIFLLNKTNFFIIIFFLICSFISIYYYLKLIKIINFNPNNFESYKMYLLNSLSSFFIIFYSFFLLSPYFFIFGKFLYIILNNIFKNYLYNIFFYLRYIDKHQLIIILYNKYNSINFKYMVLKLSIIFYKFNIYLKTKYNFWLSYIYKNSFDVKILLKYIYFKNFYKNKIIKKSYDIR